MQTEYLVLRILRGRRGELRVTRKRYRDGTPYTELRHWYPDEATGEVRPGSGLTLKDVELGEVVSALRRIVNHLTRTRLRGELPGSPQLDAPRSANAPAPEAAPVLSDAELAELESLF